MSDEHTKRPRVARVSQGGVEDRLRAAFRAVEDQPLPQEIVDRIAHPQGPAPRRDRRS